MPHDNEGIEGVPRVSIEGDLPFWTKGELKKLGLGFWDDKKKTRGTGLPEVVVATAKALKKPSPFFRACRENRVPTCTEDWLHACTTAVDKDEPLPSYKSGPWCFRDATGTHLVHESGLLGPLSQKKGKGKKGKGKKGKRTIARRLDDDKESDEEHGTENDEGNQRRSKMAEVGGTRLTYDYIGFSYYGDVWEAISVADVGRSGGAGTLAIRQHEDKKVAEANWIGCCLYAPTVSKMEKVGFPTLHPVQEEDLPDRMDDIWVIAYDQLRGSWLLCVWKENSFRSEHFDARDFKLVESKALQLKYDLDEVNLWLSALGREARQGVRFCESSVRGGSRALQNVLKRLE